MIVLQICAFLIKNRILDQKMGLESKIAVTERRGRLTGYKLCAHDTYRKTHYGAVIICLLKNKAA